MGYTGFSRRVYLGLRVYRVWGFRVLGFRDSRQGRFGVLEGLRSLEGFAGV